MKLAILINQNFRNGVVALAKQKLPLRTGFKLKGIIKRINEEYQRYEDCRIEAVKRFADKDEAGEPMFDENGNAKISQENLELFVKEIQELANTEVEVPTLTLEELGTDASLTVEEIMNLEGLVLG